MDPVSTDAATLEDSMRHRIRPASLLRVLALLPILAACDRLPTEPQHAGGLDELRAAQLAVPPVATRPNLLVSADWLLTHGSRPNVVVLHVGSPAGYASAHVGGAQFVNLSSLQATLDGVPLMLHPATTLRAVMQAAGVSTSDHVVVYGDGPLQAARGFFVLDYLGHPRVSLLDGGLPAWSAIGGAVVTGAPALTGPGSMRTPVVERRFASSSFVLQRLYAPGTVLIDARPAANFQAGRIPGAASLPWTNLVQSTSLPLLRPVGELRTMFADAGADRRLELVVYCTSGMMSSVSYFVARYLGYDVRLYDGSMLQWTALELPIES
jgi:thiosulfate/3-mercaptopyruvate sulfurtransferase